MFTWCWNIALADHYEAYVRNSQATAFQRLEQHGTLRKFCRVSTSCTSVSVFTET